VLFNNFVLAGFNGLSGTIPAELDNLIGDICFGKFQPSVCCTRYFFVIVSKQKIVPPLSFTVEGNDLTQRKGYEC
jgi:hypothetical protein